MIITPRLILLPAEPDLLRADMAGPQALEVALQAYLPGLRVAAGWPTEHYDADAADWVLRAIEEHGAPGWWSHYFILKEENLLVGVGGYKGPPDAEGTVEIGYSIVEPYQRRGLASEAARALIEHAFADDRVCSVTAETLVGHVASIGVMEKCGLSYEGPTAEEGVIRYRIPAPDRPNC